MSKEKLIYSTALHSETMSLPSHSVRKREVESWVFDELPHATVVSVSRPDTSDISAILFSYTIEFQYKQFKWSLVKKASQVLYLHFKLKKRAIVAELHEKQEQVKEWLHSLGIVVSAAVIQDEEEPEDGAISVHHEDSVKNRYVPSRAALPIIRPALGGQQAIADVAKGAMQGYMNHVFGNLDNVNSPEVCKFMEVSKLSFLREYGPKLKEGYVMVKHVQSVPPRDDTHMECGACLWLGCCKNSWHKVWAVLKPGFLALLNDPFDNQLLDIIVFGELPTSTGNEGSQSLLAYHIKERNPLRYTFKVSDGNRSLRIRTSSSGQVREWINAINKTALRPIEGWCQPHRFGSFAPPRGLTEDGSQAQWFIDGKAAFEAIASAIESATSEIFITGWWVCPELYLRRPFGCHFSSRLDSLLEAKANQGVQIYLLIYKEVSIALKINSAYSKKRLLNIHENVRVLRYPDHLSTGIYLWSHHEKLVIIDYKVSFIGGLDLCFGRYDTMEHNVGDYPSFIWPGKDYYNPRESEPNSWEDTMKDELDRTKYPRMPWHDVLCVVWGPACRDIARHFVQRWNFAKRNKAPNEETIPLLIPHHHMVIPHYMGTSNQRDMEKNNTEEKHKPISRQNSFSSQSPIEDIPLLLPREADGLASSKLKSKLYGLEKDHDLHNQPNEFSNNDYLDSADFQSNGSIKTVTQSGIKISDECLENLEEHNHDAAAYYLGEVGPCVACKCQVIRSASQWSAGTSQTEESIHSVYCSLIEKAEHFIYIENQFFISGLSGDEIIQNRVLEALYKRIVRAYKEHKCFRVILVLPLLPGFKGGLHDGGAATVRAILHWQYRTISWEKTSILYNLEVLLGSKTNDYISFYSLRSYGRLFEGGPVATSQVYVHSKLMIIDDRVALIGSSNINDRSLLGSRDSEIALVVEDKEFLQSSMNGRPWKAGKFAFTLRCSLWAEHLGLRAGETNQIKDPVSDKTYTYLWAGTAKENAKIYQDVFSCIPNDHILSRAALRQCMSYWKEKIGHTTIDLGIAEEKLEQSYESDKVKATDPMERLKSIKGHLVSLPLKFMCEEDLRPVFIESEFYAAPQVFH